jgi:CheY-like chemotaxis protein
MAIVGESHFLGCGAGVLLAQLDNAYENLMSEKNILGTFVALLIMALVYMYFAHGRQYFEDRHKERLATQERHNKMVDTLVTQNNDHRENARELVKQGAQHADNSELTAIAMREMAQSIRAASLSVLLVIEDAPTDIARIRGMLDKLPNRAEFAVVWAKTLEEAQPRWNAATVILADLNLPDSDWPRTLDVMTSVCGSKPVFFYTGSDDVAALKRAAEMGVAVFRKDQDMRPMLQAISKALNTNAFFHLQGEEGAA